MVDVKDVITVAAATPIDAAMNTTRTAGEPADVGGAESAGAGALDLLLPQATAGVLRRFRPDASMARYAFRLARRPGTVAARYGKLAAELASIAAGRSAIAPQPRDRRFSDPAWSENPGSSAPFRPIWLSGRPPRGCWLTPSWTGGTIRA